MTTATAAPEPAIFYRSRRRVAAWALALTLGGAVAGTATTLAVTHDDNAASKPVPAADSHDSYNYKLGPGPH